jgi:hypothetical protein
MQFRHRHLGRLRLFATILGWGDLSSGSAMREFVPQPSVRLVPTFDDLLERESMQRKPLLGYGYPHTVSTRA